MDVDYARLANAVPLPEGIKNVPKGATKPTVVSNAQQAYTSPPPEEVNFFTLFFFYNSLRHSLLGYDTGSYESIQNMHFLMRFRIVI